MDITKMLDAKAKTVTGLTGGIEHLLKKHKVDYFKGKVSCGYWLLDIGYFQYFVYFPCTSVLVIIHTYATIIVTTIRGNSPVPTVST